MENQLAIFETEDGKISLSVQFENETVWLTQAQMSDLFGKSRVTVTEHIGNVFKEGELVESAVCRKFRHTAADGKAYETQYYNLDVIISVGYRIKSKRGTQFRIWATQVLRQHLVEGYTLNRKRLDELHRIIQLIAGSLSTDALNVTEVFSNSSTRIYKLSNNETSQLLQKVQ